MSEQPFPVDDIGSQIEDTVKKSQDEFEYALITTYTVTPGYLDWFEDLDTLVCAPSNVADEIRLSENINTDQLSIEEQDVHGKCVVLWGSERIVAWVGSFNFSHAGLFTNVEWAARFEGTVKETFTLANLQEGRVEPTAVNNDRINLLLDTVQSLVRGTPSESVEDALRRWPTEPVLVHSGTENSLRRSVTRALDGISGDVTLSYFTANMNKTGVRKLTSLAPPNVDEDQIAVEVYGSQPSAVIDDTQPSIGSFLGSNDVQELKGQFREFVLRTRLGGDDGEVLPSGSQIRGGLAHLKVLVISETKGDQTEIREVLLTSANLTANAWEKHGDNVEYGIWLRNSRRVASAGTFFLNSLAECYGRADERTLTEIDERIEAGSGGFLPFDRRSIADLTAAHLQSSGKTLNIEWPDDEVPYEIDGGKWYLRDIVTGEPDIPDANLSEDSVQIDSLVADRQQNRYVEALELQVRTTVEVPAYELSGKDLTRLANDSLDQPIEDWDRIVIDGAVYPADTKIPKEVLKSGGSGYLYRCHERPLSRTVRLDADHLKSAGFNDPLLPETILTDITATRMEVDGLGELPCLNLTFSPGLSPPIDGIEFQTATATMNPIGWMKTTDGRRYVFEPTSSPLSLTVSPCRPFAIHYPDESHDCTLPKYDSDTGRSLDTVRTRLEQLRDVEPLYTLADVNVPDIPDLDADIDPFVHEDTALSIFLTVETDNDIPIQKTAYETVRQGYFYDPPIKQDSSETYTPPAPYSKIEVRGLLGLETAAEPLWIYAGATTIDTQKRLIATLRPTADVPTSLPLMSLDSDQVIMWLGFDFDDLVVEDVGEDAVEDLVFECWRGETKLDQSRPIRALKEPPEYFAVPLFTSHLEESVTYRVVIRPSEAETKYAWSANEYEISLKQQPNDDFKLDIDGQMTFKIRDDATAKPMIDLPRLSKVRLGEEFPYHACLENKSDLRPETIQQWEEVVLHFVKGPE